MTTKSTTLTMRVLPLTLSIAGALILAACIWVSIRLWNYEAHEPLRNGVSAMKEGDYEKARSLIEPFARRANPLASELMGKMYAFGLGVRQDSSEAQVWYRIAECECLDPGQNEFNTAVNFAGGLDGAKKDPQLALWWLQRAEEAGNPEARKLLSDPAQASLRGFGVPAHSTGNSTTNVQ